MPTGSSPCGRRSAWCRFSNAGSNRGCSNVSWMPSCRSWSRTGTCLAPSACSRPRSGSGSVSRTTTTSGNVRATPPWRRWKGGRPFRADRRRRTSSCSATPTSSTGPSRRGAPACSASTSTWERGARAHPTRRGRSRPCCRSSASPWNRDGASLPPCAISRGRRGCCSDSRWNDEEGKRVILLAAAAALLVAAPAQERASPATGGGRKPPHAKAVRRLPPEQDPKLGGAAKAFAKATVSFAAPDDRAVLKRDQVEVQLKIAHYALVGGAHAHVIFDNEPALEVDDVEDPIVLKDVPPGPHVLRAVLCRPWHEVVKAKGAFTVVRFWAGPRFLGRAGELAERAVWPDPRKPLLTYVLPIGQRTKGARGFESDGTEAAGSDDSEPAPPAGKKPDVPTLDFYVSNTQLGKRASKVRVVLDKAELPLITSLEPKKLARLKPGEHRITIDLLDSKAQKIANALNRTDRTFVVK